MLRLTKEHTPMSDNKPPINPEDLSDEQIQALIDGKGPEDIQSSESADVEADLISEEAPTETEDNTVDLPDEELSKFTENARGIVDEPYSIGIEHTKGRETVSIPPTFMKDIVKTLNSIPTGATLQDSVNGANWVRVLNDSLHNGQFADVFGRTLNDEEAEFHNSIEFNGNKLNPSAPKFKTVANEKLEGDRALFRIINSLQVGSLFNCPLWHSGLWVTFRPPGDTDILSLNESLKRNKINLGRFTYGLAFSNVSSYINDELIDFALAHVYNVTASADSGITVENLKEHILAPDIPILLWGLACSIYPNGFNYEVACPNDPMSCNHVISEVLDPSKLLWPNFKALGKEQLAHMSGRQPRSKSLASIVNYKESLTNMLPRRFEHKLASGSVLAFELSVPNIARYVDSGHEWIGSIVELVDEVLEHEPSDEERNTLVQRYASATILRQYGHWVSKIEIDGNSIEEENTIKRSLDALSTDEDVRAKFLLEVVKFIEDSTIAVIGMPQYVCPVCDTEKEPNLKGDYVNLISLNVVSIFFDLLTQRAIRIRRR